jgi:hypothetical protein
VGIDPAPGRCWPLHPQPGEWEVLETWVRRIAQAYGIGYDAFLRHALGRTGRGARHLEDITDAELARLAVGTGIRIECLRGMNIAAIMRRLNMTAQNWMLTDEGSKTLEELNITLGLMVHRAMERRTKDRLTINEQLGYKGD